MRAQQTHISNNKNKKHFINFDFYQDNKNTLSFKEVKNYVSNKDFPIDTDINEIIYEYLEKKYINNNNNDNNNSSYNNTSFDNNNGSS